MKAYCPCIISNSWKPMTSLVNYFVGLMFLICATLCHFQPFCMYGSSVTYTWRFANPRPPQCMCGHCVRCSQSPKTKCSKLAIVNLKLITLKGIFTFQNFLLQVYKGDPFCLGLHVSSNNHLLVISSLNCMHTTKMHGFIWTWSWQQGPFNESKDNQIWFFLLQAHAFSWDVGWTTILQHL